VSGFKECVGGGMGGWVEGWKGGRCVRYGWIGGRKDGWAGLRVGFININDVQ
jgi:hypothetical protein